MKKYISIISFLILLTSCAKLDVQPTQSIPAETAIQTESDLNQALNGCYDALQLPGFYGRHTVLATELSSDNGNATGTILEYNDINLNNMLSNNTIVESMWSAYYIAINRVNNAIYYLPNVGNISEANKNDILGQLYFIRGLAYFNLVRYFGDVPLRLSHTSSTDDLDYPRTPVSVVLDQVTKDLVFASENITTVDEGRASSASSEALLASISLYQGRWSDAETHATNVINNPGYSMVLNYESLFDIEGNSESIFEVQYNDLDKNRMAEYVFPTTEQGRYEVSPSEDLIGSFPEGDLRFAASINDSTENPYSIKYWQISTGADRVYVFRLAEMYLIRAEARIKMQSSQAGINEDLNRIRQRASLDPVNIQDYDALLEELLLQRRLEFNFEGKRWFDLVRNNLAIPVLPNVSGPNQLLFPIPLAEINTNTAIGPENQNPGY
jgi:hypothetical protein